MKTIRLRKLRAAALVWVAVGWVFPAASDAGEGVRWRTDLRAAVEEAAQTNRLVLVHWWAPWCGPCRQMEKDVFAEPAVGTALESVFVPVKLNSDDHPELIKQWKVTALPSDYVIAPDGRLVGRENGYRNATQYVAMLQTVTGRPLGQIAAAPAAAAANPFQVGATVGVERTANSVEEAGNRFNRSLNQLQENGTQAARTVNGFTVDARETMTAATAGYGANGVPPGAVPGTAPPITGSAFVQPFADAAQQARESAGAVAGQAQGQVAGARDQFGRLVGDVRQQATGAFGQTQQQLDAARQQAQTAAADAAAKAREAALPAAEQARQQVAGAYQGVQNKAGQYAEAGRQQVAGAVQGAQTQAGQYAEQARQNVAGAVQGAQTQAGQYAEQGRQQVAGAGQDFYKAFAGASGAVQQDVNRTADAAREWRTNAPAGTAGAAPAAGQPAVQKSPAPAAFPTPSLDGFCPVAIASRKQWVVGDRRWGAWHRGRLYLFSGEQEQKSFLAEPEKFAPIGNGSDPVAALDEGKDLPGRVQFACLYGDRVYLFAGEATLSRFQQTPERYTAEAVQAARPIR